MDSNRLEESSVLGRFSEFFVSDEALGFRNALIDINVGLDLSEVTGQFPDPIRFGEAAQVIASTIRPWLNEGREEASGPASWIGEGNPDTLDIVKYRSRAAELMEFAGFLAAATGPAGDIVGDIAQIAFGTDPLSITIGDILRGRHLDIDPGNIPPDLAGIEDLLQGSCAAGIIQSAARYGLFASQRPRPLPGAEITDIDPKQGCGGTEVVIRGRGFGATQDEGVVVMFTNRDGGCTVAEVVSGSWKDDEIHVIAPSDVGPGCVGIIQRTGDLGGIIEAAMEFAGELVTCLGPLQTATAGRIQNSAYQIMAVCPTCDNPKATFFGGPPLVNVFSANGQATAEILPGGDVTVIWDVHGADTINIIPVQLPPVPGPYNSTGNVLIEDIEEKEGTIGEWQLTATNECGTTTREVRVVIKKVPTALVLSGGGSKAAFEVGAARCLQDVAGIKFDIFSGTSFGAFNAAMLAAGGPTAQDDLETVWLGLQADTDIYLHTSWFRTFDPIIRQIFRSSGSGIWFELGILAHDFAMNKILGSLASAMGVPGWAYTVMTSFYPVVTGIAQAVRLISAGTQAMAATSLFNPTPLENLINSTINPRRIRIASSGLELRVTAVPLESGLTRVFNEAGIMLDLGVGVPIGQAVMASAAVPISFPPVALTTARGTEHYVSGAVRENTPIAAAVEAGAQRIFAVLLVPRGLAHETGFTSPAGGASPLAVPLVKIVGRCISLALHEEMLNDVQPYRGFGVPLTIVSPTFSLCDPLLIDPGLISINMDYGYMRAFDDVLADPAIRTTMRQSSDEITALRLDIWNSEHWANGEFLPWSLPGGGIRRVPDPFEMQFVRDMKRKLLPLVRSRIRVSSNQSVPKNCSTWWQQWERHPWTPVTNSPWDSYPFGPGGLAAEPAPPPI
jgi:predicted acylesterase/phospholipase RssA